MISSRHNCIFVHIPKTGGSSIEDMLWPLKTDRTQDNLWMGFVGAHYNKYQTGGLQHLLARQIRSEVGNKIFQDALKFTIVRNPWEKAASQFKYMAKRRDLRKFLGMSKDSEFAKYLELIRKKEHVQWMEQYKFFLDVNGEIIVDDVLRFENFDIEIAAVLKKMSLEFTEVLRSNKGENECYSKLYDDETRLLVADIYSKDIEILGYSFSDMI